MNHLEYDWVSPLWQHFYHGLSRDHMLIRYDARGNGMSDWDVDEISLDAWVRDLETVVDAVKSSVSRCSGSRKAAPFPSVMLCGTRSAYPTFCFTAALHLVETSAARKKRKSAMQ